ncbi:MAG TPA: hypothetical protein VLM75_08670 [Spirochaetota bacterium]|nr:hypothetical protein [Spirochaetota bacterium]
MKKLMEEINRNNLEFITEISMEKGPGDVVRAINAYGDKMRPLTARLKELNAKYPELFGMEEPPDELKSIIEKNNATSLRLQETVAPVYKKYESTPDVRSALDNFVLGIEGIE